MDKFLKARGSWAVCSLLFVLLLASVLRAESPTTRPTTLPAFGIRAEIPRGLDELRSMERRVQDVVRRALPATVNVRVRAGQGSGIIVTPDGYILTAGHVATEPGIDCVVVLSDGRTLNAKTLGVNRDMDSGLVKLNDPGPWPCVQMGSDASLSQGQWCIALGHPGGYRRDRPPVLRIGRVLFSDAKVVFTDCTLVGGDSGGPLLDLDGKVIGIHSRIGQSTSANMHVPVDTFVATWQRLTKGELWGARAGRKAGPSIGILGADDPKGCRVERVFPASGAYKAGLKIGDIITRFDNKPVKDFDSVATLLFKHKPSEEIAVEVLRGTEKMKFKVKLGSEMP